MTLTRTAGPTPGTITFALAGVLIRSATILTVKGTSCNYNDLKVELVIQNSYVCNMFVYIVNKFVILLLLLQK